MLTAVLLQMSLTLIVFSVKIVIKHWFSRSTFLVYLFFFWDNYNRFFVQPKISKFYIQFLDIKNSFSEVFKVVLKNVLLQNKFKNVLQHCWSDASDGYN